MEPISMITNEQKDKALLSNIYTVTQRHHQATHYPACLRRHSTPGSYYNIVMPTYKQYQGVIQIIL